MECICPNCGRKLRSEDLGFDFTDFIREKVLDMIKGETKPESSKIIPDCERMFNSWKSEKPILESEETLWNLEESEKSMEGDRNRYVIYHLPYKEIFERVSAEKEGYRFKEWLEKFKIKIERTPYVLWLQKTGDGRIRINRVFEKETGIKIAPVRQCPECYGVMSYWSGRYQEICLTVLGGPRISKSTTLTACAAAFMESDSHICWEGTPEDSEWISFEENYLKLYQDGKPLRPTDVSEDKIPRVSFRVSISGKKICLTFIDLPGEFNGGEGLDEKIYRRYKNFYDNIDFVWYCTDAAEVMQLLGKEKEALGYEEQQEIIKTSRLLSNMENLSSFFTRSNRKVPVIYILGKTDTDIISPEEKMEFALFNPEEQDDDEVLDIRQFYEQAVRVKNYIQKYNPNMVRQFEESFEDRCYTAISAYGYNPKEIDSTKSYIERRPYHCKLPFYWMLALRSCMEVRLVAQRTSLWGMKKKKEEFQGRLKELPDAIRQKAEYNLYMHGPYKI